MKYFVVVYHLLRFTISDDKHFSQKLVIIARLLHIKYLPFYFNPHQSFKTLFSHITLNFIDLLFIIFWENLLEWRRIKTDFMTWSLFNWIWMLCLSFIVISPALSLFGSNWLFYNFISCSLSFWVRIQRRVRDVLIFIISHFVLKQK